MPSHLHVVLETARIETTVATLTRILARQGEIAKLAPSAWEVPPPANIPDRKHLARQVRYVALNPCRDRLCKDPLEWIWSTYRGTMGALADPWVPADRLAGALGERLAGFRERHHAYVSGDPSVAIGSTPFPRAAPRRDYAEVPLARIAEAAATATESRIDDIKKRTLARRLFILLASHQGWADTLVLSNYSGVRRDSIPDIRKRPAPALLAAGALCLGDARLRISPRRPAR